LEQINPKTEPGTLGICLSGAGPTVLILSNQRQEEIAKKCQQVLKTEGNVDSFALHLEVDFDGAQTSVVNLSQ
jgi:homoserine kinase